MRLRNVHNADEKLIQSAYFITNPEQYKKMMKSLFLLDQPIHIEIGVGKGNFIIEMAKQHPEINFIGIEKYASVLVRAVEKANQEELRNLKFLCIDAKNIAQYFEREITTIYLNFSDPWPKKRHAKRRLTSPEFLEQYDHIFKQKNHIILKTDNDSLFQYSLEQLSKHGYILEKVSLNLANENIENIKTEYEEKFESLGYKIKYVEAYQEKN